MKRKKAEDKNGKFEEIVMKWMGPKIGFQEISREDPDFQKWNAKQYALKKMPTKK